MTNVTGKFRLFAGLLAHFEHRQKSLLRNVNFTDALHALLALLFAFPGVCAYG